MNAIVQINSGVDVYRQSTDAAGLCGAIVKQTARDIQGRHYVTVEGWQAIAIAHGSAAGARDVEKVDGGVRAIGEVRRLSEDRKGVVWGKRVSVGVELGDGRGIIKKKKR